MTVLPLTSQSIAMRDAFLEEIWKRMTLDDRIFFVTADFGSPVLDKIRKGYPSRFMNVGVAEQNLINVSCGLALEGFCVFAYAIAPFITMRCFEQIRVNLSLLSQVRPMNVNLIGVGAGYSYAMSGPTHQCYEDISLMRALPPMQIFSPSDHIMASRLFENCVKESRPKYLRFDAQLLPVLPNLSSGLELGFVIRNKGKGLCLIATGYMVHTALLVVNMLTQMGISASLVDLYDITDFDRDELMGFMRSHSHIVTMEEGFHGRGGVDALFFEWITQENMDLRMLNVGVEPIYSFALGTRQEMHERVGLSPDLIFNRVIEFYPHVSKHDGRCS